MKYGLLIYLAVWFWAGDLAAQDDVLFRIDDEVIYTKEVYELLNVRDETQSLSIEQFNNVLNFYLSVYDVKARGEDTTKIFRQKLESHLLYMVGGVYGANNHSEILAKCTFDRKKIAIVDDLFVPFEPILLQELEHMIEQGKSLEELTKYAAQYEGSYSTQHLMIPEKSSWVLDRILCTLIDNNSHSPKRIVGPIKDLKGYHYIRMIGEKDNIGRIKGQIIALKDDENKRREEIEEIYRLVGNESFTELVKRYSEYPNTREGTVSFVQRIDMDSVLEQNLKTLEVDGDITKPFYSQGYWCIVKRLVKEKYPSEKDLLDKALNNAMSPSFFIEDMKDKYGAKEYPEHFMDGKNDILFLIAGTPYYEKDLVEYAKDFGYEVNTETYDRYFNHLLLSEYIKELEPDRYQRLKDDYYFLYLQTPTMSYKKSLDKSLFIKDLRRLIVKYNPVVTDRKYVENNPAFDEK